MKKGLILLVAWTFAVNTIYFPVHAADAKDSSRTKPYVVRGDEQNIKSGSVYYASNKKDEVLLRGNIWGAVQFPGVHYLPIGTRLLDALSIAGGPLDSADKDELILSTKTPQGLEIKKISVYQALSDNNHNPFIQAEDIIVVKENRSYQNWNLALQAGTFIISAIVLGMVVEDRNKK